MTNEPKGETFGVADYGDKFADSGNRVLMMAIGEARNRQQNYISLWHLILALSREDAVSFERLIRFLHLNPEIVNELIEKAVAASPVHLGKGVRIAPEVNVLFREARDLAKLHKRDRIEAADMLLVLANSIKLGPPWSDTYWGTQNQ